MNISKLASAVDQASGYATLDIAINRKSTLLVKVWGLILINGEFTKARMILIKQVVIKLYKNNSGLKLLASD